MKPAHILIDFENVQPNELGVIDPSAFKIKVFVGARQSRVGLGLAQALQPLGAAAEYVQIEGSGRNALDLHIAYYIGRLSITEPDAVFHIVSKDSDYLPLIEHLKKKFKVQCYRRAAITDIPHLRAPAVPAPVKAAAKAPAKTAKAVPKAPAKPAPAKTAPAKPSQVDAVIANLVKRGSALPSSVDKLASTIKSALGNRVTDKAVHTLIEELKLRGRITVADGKVTYHLT